MIWGFVLFALLALAIAMTQEVVGHVRRRNRLIRDHEAVMERLRQRQEDLRRRSDELRKLQNRNQP